jgi:5-exo-hydroxycamphor dehydrogenase
MSDKGRAAVLVEPNRVEIWEVPIADPEPGGVLVRMVLGGVCGSDLHIVNGDVGVMPFPIVLGHEGIGRVEKLGAALTKDYASVPVAEGDLVYWAPTALCGHCYACNVLDQPPCENAQFFEHAERPNWGSLADYAWLPKDMAFFRLPEGAQPEALAALGCALPTAIAGLEKVGRVGLGDSVVIQGAGPVGLSAVLVSALSGAVHVIVIDAVASRLEIAQTLGATHTILLSATTVEQRREEVYEIVGANGPNIVLEAAGALPAFAEGVGLTGNHGRYIILGLWGAVGTSAISPRDLTIKNMAIVGETFHKNRHYYAAMMLAARIQNRYPLADLITHRFKIENTTGALEAIASGDAVKAVIDPSL